MNAARIEKSKRLQRVDSLLSDGREYSTMQIIDAACVCAVNSVIAELRSNGGRSPVGGLRTTFGSIRGNSNGHVNRRFFHRVRVFHFADPCGGSDGRAPSQARQVVALMKTRRHTDNHMTAPQVCFLTALTAGLMFSTIYLIWRGI